MQIIDTGALRIYALELLKIINFCVVFHYYGHHRMRQVLVLLNEAEKVLY